MLQVSVLRNDPQWAKERLILKGFSQPELVDTIISLDDQRKKTQNEFDHNQSQVNQASKQIGGLMAKGQTQEAETLKATVAELKTTLDPLKESMQQIEKQLYDTLVLLPNLPGAVVPAGKSAEDNEVVRAGGIRKELPSNAQPHWDLINQYRLVDFETGAKITGRGFPLYIGKGAKLQRSLVQYFLDYNTAAGYTEYLPPFMVNEASAFATGQLPDKEGQMYFMEADQFYLIPTAEVPVTNIYRDTIVKEEELPIKMTAYSPCFRREAGSFGKDVRGLNRVHQFEKVELYTICKPEDAKIEQERMLAAAENILQKLGLHYRISLLAAQDCSFASAKTFDIEVWMPGQNAYYEVSSCSNCTDFQARRTGLRFKDDKKNSLVYTLNCSALAIPRLMVALM